MAETAPTTPATTSTATTVLPPPPSYAAAADKARAAIKAEGAPVPAPAAAPATPAAPAPGIETKGLADITRLSAENRALQTKVRELEPAAKDAALLKEVRDLYASGKKVAAIGKLAGADPTAEMEGLLADYLKDPNDPATQDKLAAKVDEVAKRIDASAQATQAQAQAAEHAKAASGVVDSQLTERIERLPHTAKADRQEAIGKVISTVTRLREEKGLSVEASTPEVMTAILADAIDEVEIEYEIRHARAARANPDNTARPTTAIAPQQTAVAPTPAPAVPAEPAPSIESLERPGVSVAEWGKTLTHDKAKEKLRALVRAG
jgi:hypothetical protein